MKEKILKILHEYKGTVKTATNNYGDTVWIERMNKIASYYTNGEIHKQQTVFCKVGVYLSDNTMFASEQTYSILGSSAGYNFDEASLRELLEKYGFEQKLQISFL